MGLLAVDHLVMGELLAEMGRRGEAEAAWRRTVEVITPITQGDDAALEDLDTHAWALLSLGEFEAVRPLLERLEAGGWQSEELEELKRDAGVLGP